MRCQPDRLGRHGLCYRPVLHLIEADPDRNAALIKITMFCENVAQCRHRHVRTRIFDQQARFLVFRINGERDGVQLVVVNIIGHATLSRISRKAGTSPSNASSMVSSPASTSSSRALARARKTRRGSACGESGEGLFSEAIWPPSQSTSKAPRAPTTPGLFAPLMQKSPAQLDTLTAGHDGAAAVRL